MDDLAAIELANRLLAAYPSSRPPLGTPSLYAEYIGRVSEEVGTVAVDRLFEAYPHRVPHLGELIQVLRTTRLEMTPQLPEESSMPATPEQAAAILGQYLRRPVDQEATTVDDAVR